MLSEKELLDEIRLVKIAVKRCLKQKRLLEAAKEQIVLETLEFVHEWKENE